MNTCTVMYACKYFTYLMCRVPTSVYEAETISIYCGFICKTFCHMDTFSTWCKDKDALILDAGGSFDFRSRLTSCTPAEMSVHLEIAADNILPTS